MKNFCLKYIFKCTDTVLQGAVCLPWNILYPTWSVTTICNNTASSVKLMAVFFLDRTQGFGLLSTLAGANCSIGSEENQDTEVNSNSYFLFFAHTVSCVALSCCHTWWGGGLLFFLISQGMLHSLLECLLKETFLKSEKLCAFFLEVLLRQLFLGAVTSWL